MLKIRMKRFGRKNQKTYRVVVVHSKKGRDARVLEEVGFYNPMTRETRLDLERIEVRLSQGAQASNIVKNLLTKAK